MLIDSHMKYEGVEGIAEEIRRLSVKLSKEETIEQVEVQGLDFEAMSWEEGDVSFRHVLMYASHHCRECFECEPSFGAMVYREQVRIYLFLKELKKLNVKFEVEDEGNGAGTLYLSLPNETVRVDEGKPNERDVEAVAKSIKKLAEAYKNTSFEEFDRHLEEFRAKHEPDDKMKDNAAHH